MPGFAELVGIVLVYAVVIHAAGAGIYIAIRSMRRSRDRRIARIGHDEQNDAARAPRP